MILPIFYQTIMDLYLRLNLRDFFFIKVKGNFDALKTRIHQ